MLDVSVLIFDQTAVDVGYAEIHKVRSQATYGVLRDVRSQDGASRTETEYTNLRIYDFISISCMLIKKSTKLLAETDK